MIVMCPCRTRDWGTTEYHIIRTWTPRVPSTNDQPSAVEAGQSHDGNLQSNDTHQDSPPHDSEDNSAEEMDVEADINEVQCNFLLHCMPL